MEAAPGFEPGMRVLQTRALPLGDAASVVFNDPEQADARDPSPGGQLPLPDHLSACWRSHSPGYRSCSLIQVDRSRRHRSSIDAAKYTRLTPMPVPPPATVAESWTFTVKLTPSTSTPSGFGQICRHLWARRRLTALSPPRVSAL